MDATSNGNTSVDDNSKSNVHASYNNQKINLDNTQQDDSNKREIEAITPNPTYIQHNKAIQDKIAKMTFIERLDHVINTPFNNQWAVKRCMFSLQAIKKMKKYTFEPDDKITAID